MKVAQCRDGIVARITVRGTLFLAALAVSPAFAGHECGIPPILQPRAGAVVTDAKPRIEWGAVVDATRYRLLVEARVPEGRVLSVHDLQTSATSWVAPQALTDRKANVKVKVLAVCGQQDRDEAAAAIDPPQLRFRIDVTGACTLSSDPVVRGDEQSKEVSWAPTPGAQSYELAVYSALNGRLLSRTETRQAGLRLAPLPPGAWVVGVHPRCAVGQGASRFAVVNVPGNRAQ